MGIKLHGKFLALLIFLPALIWGQCPSSVSISTDTGNTICEGISVEFTANHSDGENHQYQWQVNGVNVPGKTAKVSSLDNLNNGDQIRVVVRSGSETSCTTSSDFFTINVNALSTVNAGEALAAICQGATTSALGGSFGGGATSAIWSDDGAGGTFNNNSGNNPNATTYTASASAPATVTLTLTTSGGSCGSVNTSKTLTVNPNPTVNTGGALAAICQGATTPALGGSFGGGATSAIWSDGGAGGTFNNNSGNNPNATTYTASASAPAVITLTLTTSGGSCGSVNASKTLTVNPNPTVNTGGALAAICQGATTPALGGSFGGGATSAIWSDGGAGGAFNNNSGSNPNATTYTASATAPATVTLTLTTSGGSCGSVNTSKTLTVNPNHTVNAGGALTPICQGATTQALGGSFGGGATSAIWSDGGAGGTFNNNSGNNPNETTYTASASAPATVTLTLTTSGGSCGSVNASKTLTVNPNPTVNAGGALSPICQGATTPALGGSFGGGATSAIWSDGGAGGTFINNSGNNPNATTYKASASAPATVTLTLTTIGGSCPNVNATKTLNITPSVIPSVSISSSTTNICSSNGSPVTFTATPVNGGTNPTYQWRRNGTAIPGATGPTYSATSAQTGNTISVAMTSNAACPSPATVNSNAIPLNVYPGSPSNWTGNSGKITLPASVCPPAQNLSISIPPTANAEYYVWTLPQGFTIVPGYEGKASILVNVGANATIGKNQTVTVQAFNPCGSNGSKSANINIDNFTAVTVPNPNESVCAGNSITVVGTLKGNAASGTWSETSASGSFSNIITSGTNPTTVSATYTPSIEDGTVDLIITTNAPTGNGCSNSPGTATITLTVNKPSTPPTNLNITTTTICNGQNTTLSQNGGTLGTGANWVWYSDAEYTTAVGTSTDSDASLQINPTSTTTYYLRAESSNGAPCEANVEALGSVGVVVNEPSVAPTGLTASDNTICNGENTTLTQTGGSLGTGASWIWYSDAGFTNTVGTSTDTDASLQLSPTSTTTYYLRAESSTGTPCEVNVEATGSVEVVVNDPSLVPTGLTASDNIICNGENTTLTQTGGSLGTGASWVWYTDEGYINAVGTSTDADASLEVSPSLTTTYYLRAESSNGAPCEANVVPTGSVEVVVNDPSIAPTSLTTSNNTICNGESTSLTQTGGSLGTGANWVWYSDAEYTTAVGTSTDSDASLQISPTLTTIYYLRAESSNGAPCEAIIEALGSVEVVVNEPSVAPTGLTASDNTICNGENTTLTQTGGSLGTGASWIWYSDAGFTNTVGTSTDTDASLQLSPTSTTTYYLRAESSTGTPCEVNVEATGSIEVIVNDPIEIETDLDDTVAVEVCAGFPVSFSIEATGTGLTYEWTRTKDEVTEAVGTNSPTLNIDQAAATDAGYYTVLVRGTAPCADVQSQKQVELVVNQSITITPEGQPTAEITSCVGDTNPITISVDAEGTISEYLWRKDGVPLSNGGNITGVHESTLTISNQSVSDSGVYDVVITSPNETCSQIISKKSVVTVSEPPTVNAGVDIQACSTDGTIVIGSDASAANYSTLEWTTSGSGDFEGSNSISTNYIPGAGETGQVTLTLTATGNPGCSNVFDEVIITISDLPVINSFSYSETEFCASINTPESPILDITNATLNDGAFGYSGETGKSLGINTTTGYIDPSNSDPGSYTITFEIPSDGICAAVSETFDVTITPLPTADFAYTESPVCSNSENISPTMGAGAINGIFSSTPAGLVFVDDTTGEIDIAASAPNTYTVTNTIAPAGGCDEVSASSDITITKLPIADFTYDNSPYCLNSSNPVNPVVTLGTDAEHGEYSSTAGLVFADDSTGEIDIAASTPDTYTVTNTIVAADGCEQVTATADITITQLPVADFSYAGLDENNAACISSLGLSIETMPDPNGTYSSSSLDTYLDSSTGALTWGVLSDIPIGPHVITYTIPESDGCPEVTYSETIRIDDIPEGGALAWDNNERIFLTCEVQTNTLNEVLSLSGEVGQIAEWEYRTVSSGVWQTYDSQSSSINKDDFQSILGNSVESTVFRVRIVNGACPDPNDPVYSQTAILSVIPDDIKPSPVESDPDVLCYDELVTLSSETGYGSESGKFEGGAFDQAGLDNNGMGWDFTHPNGTKFNFEGGVNNGRSSTWGRMNPHGSDPPNEKVYNSNIPADGNGTMINYRTYSGNAGNKGFALVTGDNDSHMETPVFSLTGLDEAVLTWDQAYNLTEGAVLMVEISRDGGANYPLGVPIPDLEDINFSHQDIVYFNIGDGTIATGSSDNFDHFGEGTAGINQMSIDLGDYLGETNLRVRFTFIGTIDGDVWAVDNIKVPDGPRDVQLIWYYDHSPEAGSFDPNDPDIEQIGLVNQTTVTYPQDGNPWPKLGWNDFQVRTQLILDSNGDPCESINNFETVQVFVFDKYTTVVTAEAGECGNTRVQLNATVTGDFQGDVTTDFTDTNLEFKTVDGYSGAWVITGGTDYTLINPEGTEPSILPEHNPNAIFVANDLGNYTFTWTLTPTAVYPDNYKDETLRGQIVENLGCPPEGNSVDVQMPECTTLDFDGIDDYVSIADVFAEAKTFEMWIYPEAATGTIISGPGIEIKMDDLPGVTANNRWYHIALIGNKLYIDGIDSNTTINGGTGTGDTTYIGAEWNNSENKMDDFFSGWIEEVRIWKTPLDIKEIRFMMNQRLDLSSKGGGKIVQGEIVPNLVINGSYLTDNINGETQNLFYDGIKTEPFYNVNWSDLIAYYRLISAEPDPDLGIIPITYKPVAGFSPNLALAGVDARLHNMTTHQQNTSPTPYFSMDPSFKTYDAINYSGEWGDKDTWARPDVWDPPHTGTIEWNIAKISHNIYSGDRNIKMLGLLSESGLLDIQHTDVAHSIHITHYLLLNGNIDLEGESQLLQDHGSILDNSSSGWLEANQEGRLSSFNYNYWSSPVTDWLSTNTYDNNSGYTLNNVLYDGENENEPESVYFQPGYYVADKPKTSPITISTEWIWEFRGRTADIYNQWQHLGSDFRQLVGAGYTMKGTDGTVGPDAYGQKYTFKGKPNNGNIPTNIVIDGARLYIGNNQNYLVGNPYPSAIDAQEFMKDNLTNGRSVFNGALYFWDHFSGSTHILAEYVGGYAVYNLSGVVDAASSIDSRINATGETNNNNLPTQNIPIAQGFFLNSTSIGSNTFGGEIIFRNTQRVFEPISGGNSIFKQKENKTVKQTVDNRTKIRVKFESPKGYHRQILVTRDENTSNGFDIGYDAPLIDNIAEDMYWWFAENRFVIQGVPDFEKEQILPLAVKTNAGGEFKIKIDETENWPLDKELYLKDNLTDSIHDILKQSYVGNTEVTGEITDRFELIFFKEQAHDPVIPDPDPDDVLDPNLPIIDDLVGISYSTFSKQVKISNFDLLEVDKVMIFDMGGKLIQEFDELPTEQEILLGMRPVRSGVYIVKVFCQNGICNKKIIVK